MRKGIILLVVSVCLAAGVYGQATTEGSLYAVGKQGTELGSCPLKTTTVRADISGFVTRVRVRQEFENSFSEPIEAVYVFPLSQNGAVDAMTMMVGDRIVQGRIMRREEARKTYETAKSEGKTASLLDQERTNMFTQSVANIMPGESVIVEISYVETLKYEDGAYEFVFPMTIGPRYVPAGVKDAARITPPIAATRNGSDISIEVNVNAGVPVEEIRSTSHEIDQTNFSPSTSKVTLRGEKTIPNKDFILRYDVTGKRIEDAILTHRDPRGGFFTLILQPPDNAATEDRTPKEIVFVLDTSGSMDGFPIEKAKEAMKLSLEGLYPEDTFNLITFAGDTAILFDKPLPATRANLDAAQAFLAERQGYGGTEMMKAVKAALEPSDASDHLRIVCFMTDGMVGNEDAIIAEVQRHPNARVFSFGIGSSVNRLLLDKIASEGKGEAAYVALEDDGSKAAKKFYERVRSPLLTDLSIDWNGMPVADVYPGKLTDLFTAKPVVLHGRYTKGASGMIKLRGKLAGQEYVREIRLDLPETQSENDSLATLWARTRIDELSMNRIRPENQKSGEEIDQLITTIGLDFGLMTKFTSFVAVEDRVANPNGAPTTVAVPNVLPEGMKEPDTPFRRLEVMTGLQRPPAVKFEDKNAGGGGGGGREATVPPAQGELADQSKAPTTGGTTKFPKIYGKWGENDVAYILTKPDAAATGGGTGSGRGSGSGQGNGNGSGNGNAAGVVNSAANQVVNVTSSATVDVTSSDAPIDTGSSAKVATFVNTQSIELLPKGVDFASVLRTSPGTASALSGGFSVDGASGSENSFTIDGQEVTSFRTGTLNKNNREPLNGRTLNIVEPAYPADARAAKALGKVEVAVTIGRDGIVTSARAISGNKLLRTAAEEAAMQAKFAQTIVNGLALRVSGVIVYDRLKADTVEVFLKKMKAEPLTDDDKRAAAVAAKLHFWLYDIVSRLERNVAEPSPNEAKFVRDGTADVQVELTAVSPAVLAKLKAAGFVLVSQKGSTATGRVPLGKLGTLALIDEVRVVLPKI